MTVSDRDADYEPAMTRAPSKSGDGWVIRFREVAVAEPEDPEIEITAPSLDLSSVAVDGVVDQEISDEPPTAPMPAADLRGFVEVCSPISVGRTVTPRMDEVALAALLREDIQP